MGDLTEEEQTRLSELEQDKHYFGLEDDEEIEFQTLKRKKEDGE